MLQDIKNIKSGKKELREFGLTIGIILIVLGSVALWRQKPVAPYFLGAGGFFIITGIIIPGILLPLQKVWMTFSIVLGFFMSRLILFILFYAVLTPIGLIARALGNDILDQRIDKSCKSYWRDKDTDLKDKKSYENQY